MTEFGAIWDPPQKVRSREVRTWPPLVAISTSRSDLRRSGRLSDIIFRPPPQPLHLMTLMRSPMSSRNLALILMLSASHGRARASPRT